MSSKAGYLGKIGTQDACEFRDEDAEWLLDLHLDKHGEVFSSDIDEINNVLAVQARLIPCYYTHLSPTIHFQSSEYASSVTHRLTPGIQAIVSHAATPRSSLLPYGGSCFKYRLPYRSKRKNPMSIRIHH